jgi:hypothetical protein
MRMLSRKPSKTFGGQAQYTATLTDATRQKLLAARSLLDREDPLSFGSWQPFSAFSCSRAGRLRGAHSAAMVDHYSELSLFRQIVGLALRLSAQDNRNTTLVIDQPAQAALVRVKRDFASVRT